MVPMTMGIVAVACFAASAASVPQVRMTSTLRPTRSFASSGNSFIAPTGVAALEPHVLALDIAEGIESMSKGIDGRQCCKPQDTDGDESLRLLRPHRQRPRRRAAEKRDEIAALQLTKLHPLPLSQSDSIPDWRGSSQRLAALRDFDAAGVRSGSKREF